MTMPLLAIDTAAQRLQLALLDRAGRLDTLIETLGTGHAERIFDAIAALLARNGLGYADLARLAVTTGPGSFTGLRIGISAARGIALGRRIGVVGVPSLFAMSLSGPEGVPSRVVLDARRGEAYVQDFSAPGLPLGPARLVPADRARAAIAAPCALLEPGFVDIAALARFAADADPLEFAPEPAYVREADAKPQDDKRIARR